MVFSPYTPRTPRAHTRSGSRAATAGGRGVSFRLAALAHTTILIIENKTQNMSHFKLAHQRALEACDENGAVYPLNQCIELEVMVDLQNPQITTQQIIDKINAMPDLELALWDEARGNVTVKRYVPLHHAASHGNAELVRYIVGLRTNPEQVNIANDKGMTALKYALKCRDRDVRNEIVEILRTAGAVDVEEFPAMTITCATCRATFEFTSKQRAFYAAKKYHNPKNCESCRKARK